MKRFRFLMVVLFCLLAVLIWGLGVKTAAAHASLERAEPAPDSVVAEPPERVVIWFTEPVESEFSEIMVFAANGIRVDMGDSQLLADDPMAMFVTLREEPPLAEGSYTVSWKSVSTVDGHIVRSSYVFSVGRPLETAAITPTGEGSSGPSPLEAAIRWLVLLAVAGIFGGLAFDLLVIRPALARFSSEAILAEHHQRISGRILNLIWFFMVLFLLASSGQLLLQTYNVNDSIGGRPLVLLLNATYWGQVWIGRMGLFLALVGVLPLSARLNPDRPWGQSWERPREVLALIVTGAVMLTLSLVSHAAATADIRVTAVISDYLHLLAAGAWAGGLLHFAWNAPYFLRQIPEESRRPLLVAVVPRFSVLASLCVAALILTGLFSSYAQVTVLAALDTPYGRTLLVKLALIVPLLALGAINLLWLGRRLRAEKRAGEYLGLTVRVEALLAVLVFLAVGVLVTLEPARQVASREMVGEPVSPTVLTLTDTAEGLTGTFMVDAAGIGEKDVVIELNGRNGQPVENVSDVIMTVSYPAEDLMPPIGRPTNSAPGRYEFKAVPFSLNGEWRVDVLVVRSDAFDTRLAYSFEVGDEANGENTAVADSGAIAPDGGTAVYLFAAILVLLVLIAGVIIIQLGRA